MSNKLNCAQDEEFKPNIWWDSPHCFVDKTIFFPKIYDGSSGPIPETYNTVMIELDARVKSDLDWQEPSLLAEAYAKAGLKIFWSLNLGLFSELPFSIYHPTQFQTLSLAIDCFIEKIWSKHSGYSLGVCLYKGPLDFSPSLKWDQGQRDNLQRWLEEAFENPADLKKGALCFDQISVDDLPASLVTLYAADVGFDYLDMLVQPISEQIECFVMLDAGSIKDPLLEARLQSSERSDRLRLILKNQSLSAQHIIWNAKEDSPYGYIGHGFEKTFQTEKAVMGFCVPEISKVNEKYYEYLDEALEFLLQKGYKVRVVSEANLTAEWDGLDTLIVGRKAVSAYGLRKLQGFCAAGGVIVTVEGVLGLPNEISFEEWKNR